MRQESMDGLGNHFSSLRPADLNSRSPILYSPKWPLLFPTRYSSDCFSQAIPLYTLYSILYSVFVCKEHS